MVEPDGEQTMAGRRRKRTGRSGRALCFVLAFLFLFAITINKFMLEDRLVQAQSKKEYMQSCLEDEKKRTEELENLKLEIKTKKFIEETAREKFGLTYENEIVFEPEK